jgi:cyanophycinase-like exopeptidase
MRWPRGATSGWSGSTAITTSTSSSRLPWPNSCAASRHNLTTVAEPDARLLVIMGSGETSPTMSKVHREVFARLGPPPVPAVLLDTPFGFQENADDIVAKAVTYFRESVNRPVGVASYRSANEVGSLDHETALTRVRDARWVFSGPGSPSYALRQWRASRIPSLLADKLRSGGCLTFASAAAVTLGPFALPVYEIYKVGQAPFWLEGLDLMGEMGLPAVVVPHFDNAEGGTHDTRYCWMGEARLSALEAQLPDEVFILGVDEHTACILDVDAGTASVAGRATVTVRRRGRMAKLGPGETVTIATLPALAGEAAAVALAPPSPLEPDTEATTGESPFLGEVARLQSEFDAAMEDGDPKGAVTAVLALDDLLVQWSHETFGSDEFDRGRSAFRSMVVRLGEAAQEGMRDPRTVVGPFVDALLDARARAREERRWPDSDAIRDRLVDAGVEVRDTPEGTSWDLR